MKKRAKHHNQIRSLLDDEQKEAFDKQMNTMPGNGGGQMRMHEQRYRQGL